MKPAYLLSGALLAAAMVASPDARAQNHDLYFAQAGAAITYSVAEVRVLYGAVTARTYDPKITTDTIEELKRALSGAKRQTDRATALLPTKLAKHEKKMEKLRAAIVQAERTLAKLEADIAEQTKSMVVEEEESELGEPIGAPTEKEPPPKVNWNLLKKGTKWLNKDIQAARSAFKAAAAKVVKKQLRRVPKPRGKRP